MPLGSLAFALSIILATVVLSPFTAIADAVAPLYRLDVTVEPSERTLVGKETFSPSNEKETFLVNENTVVQGVACGGKEAGMRLADAGYSLKRLTITMPEGYADNGPCVISFKGLVPDVESAREKIKRGMSFVDDAVMGQEGAFLPSSSAWYPRKAVGTAFFDVVFDMPEGYKAVMEGRWVEAREEDKRSVSRWLSTMPLDGINPVIAKFHVDKDAHRGIDIYTFFFKEDNALSKTYMEKTKYYIDLYSELFTPYPFEKFAVVENFLPTGYGMPSFTLLGSAILRLPFIPDTSLGHEFTHNWWGNSVYNDPREGIWSEALATYTADDLYAEKKGGQEARSKRLDTLAAFKNYAEKEGPALKDFSDASDQAQRAVGYGKGSYLFHMLRRLLGDDLFWKGLREFHEKNAFKYASWKDIQAAFESVSGQELDWFFSQWLAGKGGPRLSLDHARVEETADGFRVSFAVSQKRPSYRLHVPIVFETKGSRVIRDITIERPRERFEMTLEEKPLSMELDPMLENFRMLSDDEAPVTLGSFFGDENGVIVLPSAMEARAGYEAVATSLSRDYDLPVITEDDYREGYEKRPALILGGPRENGLFDRLFKAPRFRMENGLLRMDEKTFDPASTVVSFVARENARVLAAFFGHDRAMLERSAKRLPHYTNKTYIAFGKDGSVESAVIESGKPLRVEFR